MVYWYLFSGCVNSEEIHVKVFNEVDLDSDPDEDFSTLRSKYNDEILITGSQFVWGYVKAENKDGAERKLNHFLTY